MRGAAERRRECGFGADVGADVAGLADDGGAGSWGAEVTYEGNDVTGGPARSGAQGNGNVSGTFHLRDGQAHTSGGRQILTKD